MLARERGLPFPALLASIFFERVLDALAQLSFFGLALVGPDAASMGSFSSGRIRAVAAAVALGAVLVALFAVVWRGATERLFETAFRVLPERWRPAARRIAHTFLDGFASLEDAAPRGPGGRRLPRDVARHQRPDLLRHPGLRTRRCRSRPPTSSRPRPSSA